MDMNKVQASIQQVRDLVALLTRPEKMTKQEALEFYDILGADCEGWTDALSEEIANEEKANS